LAPPKSSTKPTPPGRTKDSPPPFKLEGDVKGADGKPIYGVTVTAATLSTTTDRNGHYVFKALDRSASVYIVRATQKDYTFQPDPAKVPSPSSGDASNVNFTATPKSAKK
jgi:hypothetical protein